MYTGVWSFCALFSLYVSFQQLACQSALQTSLYHYFYLTQKGPWLHLHYMFLSHSYIF